MQELAVSRAKLTIFRCTITSHIVLLIPQTGLKAELLSTETVDFILKLQRVKAAKPGAFVPGLAAAASPGPRARGGQPR